MLILVEVKGTNYNYVLGEMQEASRQITLRTSLKEGKYLVFVKAEWESDQSKPLTVFLSCKQHVQLRKSTKQEHPNMLAKMFASVVGTAPTDQIRMALPYVQYLTKVMYKETGYAFLWITVQLQPGKSEPVTVEFDERYATAHLET